MSKDYAFLAHFISEPIFLGKDAIEVNATETTLQPAEVAAAEVNQPAAPQVAIATPLAAVAEKAKANFFGKNTDFCLILTHYPTEEFISNSGKELISKMLGAIGKTLENFAVINVAKVTSQEISFPAFNKVVVFGDLAAQIGTLEGTPLIISAKNKVETGKGKKFLWTYTLEELGAQDNVGKKAFWDAFKLVVS